MRNNEEILFDRRRAYDDDEVINSDIQGGIEFDSVLGIAFFVILGIALLA